MTVKIVYKYTTQDDGWVIAEAFDEAGKRLEYATGKSEADAEGKLSELMAHLGYER